MFYSVLSLSLTFDVTLPGGQSTRHPDADKFIDMMREKLRLAIDIYEKTPLGRIFQTTRVII